MRSTIWKLSALATVVGLGLVAVVFQQRSFGKPTGAQKVATAEKGAPAPNVPGVKGAAVKTVSHKETAQDDPFGGDSADLGAPPQLDTFAETEQPANDPAARFDEPVDQIEADVRIDSATTASRTKPGAKSRVLNFKPESEMTDENSSDHTSDPNNDVASRGRGPDAANAGRPKPGLGRTPDPAALEGIPPNDGESNPLGEEDPFKQHRSAAAGGRTSGGRTSARATDSRTRSRTSEVAERPIESGEPRQNPFDQPGGGLGAGEPRNARPVEPHVPGGGEMRGLGPAEYAEGNDMSRSAAVAPAGAEMPDSNGYGPENQFPPETPAMPAGGRGKSRPGFGSDEEDSFGQPRGMTVDSGEPQGPARRTNPRIGGAENHTAAEPAMIQQDGIESIPKVSRRSAEPSMSEEGLTPPVRQRGRPTGLLGDGDEEMGRPAAGMPAVPGGDENSFETTPRGRESEPQITDSAVVPRNPRRATGRVLEIPPDNAMGPGPVGEQQPESAASRQSRTDVIASPRRLASAGGMPNNPTGNGGRATVTIEKRAPATAYIGQPLVYHIVIRNVGNGPAQQVLVEDILPNGVAMQGSIPQAELVNRKLSWKIGTLAAGEERKVSVKVIPGVEGAVGSAATVNFVADTGMSAAADADATQPPPYAGGVPANGDSSSNRGGVTLEMQAPQQVSVGQPFEVRIRLSNRTSQPANNVMIRKLLPSGLQHQSRLQDLEYKVGTLAPGEVRDVPMTLTAVQPGRAVSRAMLMGADNQTLHSNEVAIDVQGAGN